MLEDVQLYLILHFPFIAIMLGLVVTEFSMRGMKPIGALFLLIHVISVIAYAFKLGDDFGRGAYFMMYLVVPTAVLCFKHELKPPAERCPIWYMPYAVIIVPLLGVAGLLAALTVFPLDWR